MRNRKESLTARLLRYPTRFRSLAARVAKRRGDLARPVATCSGITAYFQSVRRFIITREPPTPDARVLIETAPVWGDFGILPNAWGIKSAALANRS